MGFIGWFEDSNRIYVAMEYCQHGDLAGFITSTPHKIDEGCAKDIVQQILEVQFLHSQLWIQAFLC